MPRRIMSSLSLALGLMTAVPALAQGPPDPGPLLAAERAAMDKLSFMDGVWRGPS